MPLCLFMTRSSVRIGELGTVQVCVELVCVLLVTVERPFVDGVAARSIERTKRHCSDRLALFARARVAKSSPSVSSGKRGRLLRI